MNFAPIVLFVFNRPWHTKQTIESLKNNRYADLSDLFIFADGPKQGKADSEIIKVRDYLKTISGFQSITIIEQKQNIGLANSIIKGVTEIVGKFGKVIVLEDDLETSPDFLRYMNNALDRYDKDDQVMQISGHMFNLKIDTLTDAVFLPFTNSIGWATWKRAWDNLDPLMHGYKELKKSNKKILKFNLDGAYDYFGMIESQLNGQIDSWAIRWYLSVFMAGGMVLYPVNSLVRHFGFGDGATHSRFSNASGIYATSCSLLNRQQIVFPDVFVNEAVYLQVKLLLSSSQSFISRLKVRCLSILTKLITSKY